ncbi:chemotaxis protein CheW [Roseateles sp.]|uniref:chemotaxis protein CheW n=1 Tax=Roseateles sp. TaxID=1971397 RepID=UPI003D1350B4
MNLNPQHPDGGATPADADAGAPANDGSADRQFVTFSVAGEMFAVPMGPVQEIIRLPEVAQLPLAPHALEGLANLRGRVLPIINLRSLFGAARREADDATRALVINLGQALGFIVDHVASVVNVEPSQIQAADAIQSVVRTEYLSGLIQQERPEGGTQLLLILDFERLVQAQFAGLQAAGELRRETRESRGSRESCGADTPGALLTSEAGPQTEGERSAGEDLLLVSFTVAGQEYGISINDVQEIVQLPEHITSLPNAPVHVSGLISLRRRLLPLLDLRSLFGLGSIAADEHHRIVVVALPPAAPGGEPALVGLITDTVKEVIHVPRRQNEPMPGILARDVQMQEFASICRLDEGRRLVSVISTQALLGLDAVQEAAALQLSPGTFPTDSADAETATMHSSPTEASSLEQQEDLQVVIFRLGAEEFGVPIMSVQEIVRVPELLTRVPKTPSYVEGVINLRGTVLPVIDQRSRLGMATLERNDRQRIMVFMVDGMRTGFIVDSVAEVLRINRHSVSPAPALSVEQGRLITQVAKLDDNKRLVMLIDQRQLLDAGEALAMEQAFESRQSQAQEAVLARAA